MKIDEDLTPVSCPAVYELDNGRLLIVGEYASELMRGDFKVDDAEAAIVIDRALLANVTGE